MRSEPDFELLPPPRLPAAWRAALALCSAGAVLALASTAALWHLQRQSQSEWQRALQVSQRPLLPPPAPEPAYASVAREAMTLMQRPIDGWLRELERCLPERARVRELRVDARAARVMAQVDLQGELALAPWLQCLNAGLESPAWRVSQVGAATDAATPVSSAWRPAWTVVLERAESS